MRTGFRELDLEIHRRDPLSVLHKRLHIPSERHARGIHHAGELEQGCEARE